MRRLISAVLAVGVLTLAAWGQDPQPPRVDVPKLGDKKDTLEDDIARAIRTHPDVQVAEAEAQLANAKLQQVRLALAQKVAAARREKEHTRSDLVVALKRIDSVKSTVASGAKHLERFKQLQGNGQVAATEVQAAEVAHEKAHLGLLEAEQALELAKSKVATAEAEYDALVGKTNLEKIPVLGRVFTAADKSVKADADVFLYYQSFYATAVKPGSVADKLRTALAKSIAYECKTERVDVIVKALKALAGTDVMIRVPAYSSAVTLEKTELSFGAWLELVRDEWNVTASAPNEWYVREYGLTFSPHGRPEGAVTLGEFLRAMNAEKKADAAPKK